MVIEMVYTFEAENFNQIYRKVFDTVMSEGHEISPRGKRTKELNPAIIKINNPRQRYCSSRAGFNLPFSIAEVLWILKGVGDNEMISHYLKRRYLVTPPPKFHRMKIQLQVISLPPCSYCKCNCFRFTFSQRYRKLQRPRI